MKIPKKLKIAGYEYSVEFSEDLARDKDLFGDFNGRMQRIRIEKSLTKERQFGVLLHEIIEAIDYHYQLELEHNKIKAFETALYQVLKDNDMLNMGG